MPGGLGVPSRSRLRLWAQRDGRLFFLSGAARRDRRDLAVRNPGDPPGGHPGQDEDPSGKQRFRSLPDR